MYDRDRRYVVPPDGGWGWVVVVAAFLVCAIVDGIAMNAATIYVNFPSFIRAMNAEHAKLPAPRCIDALNGESIPCPILESGNSSALSSSSSLSGSSGTSDIEAEASFDPMANFFIGATLISIYMLIGPFSAALINVYGSRRIIIIGSVIAAVGFSLSALLIEHERVLLLTHGVAGGIGLGLMNVGAIVSVGLYFNTRRSLAIGLALCGSGAGMTIAPLVIEPILTEHGLYYAYVILACFSLQGVVAGVLVRPIRPISSEKKIQSRRKDVVDRVLEWSKNVKHIRSDSVTSIDNPDRLHRVKQEVLKTRSQRIQRLEIDSVPSSNIGSRLSLGGQPIQTITPSTGLTEVLYSPTPRFDQVFCQVFGSDLLSPFPGQSAASSLPQSAASPNRISPSNQFMSTTVASVTPNPASCSYDIPPPIFFLTLPIPAAGISSQHPGMAPDELFRFTRPSACVCSVLLDGGMLVASKIISAQNFAKSCPDLSNQEQEGSLLRRRRIVHRPQPRVQPEISATPSTTRTRTRRRRQRSSGRSNGPPLMEAIDSAFPEEAEENVPPLPTASTAQTVTCNNNRNRAPGGAGAVSAMTGDDEDALPEVVISNIPLQPRRMIRRRTGAVLEEPSALLAVESGVASSEGNTQRDSGISNSSGNSDTSDKASQKLAIDDVILNVGQSPKNVVFSDDYGGDDQENLLDHPDDDSDEADHEGGDEHPEDIDANEGEQSQSTKSYLERRRRRRQLTRDMSSRDVRGDLSAVGLEASSPNVFRHLISVLEAILDISLLKDLRFWIILFGNLLLMVTFLLLPLNADVVKTIRALDGLQAQMALAATPLPPSLQAMSPLSVDFLVDDQNSSLPLILASGEMSITDDVVTEEGGEKPQWTPEEDYFGPTELYEPMPHMYAILLSVCGCTQTIVRAVAGFFADYPRVDATIMVTVAMAVGSVAFFLLGLEEILQLGIGVFFALLVVVSACSGVFFALATSVIVDTFGVNRLTSCFGMITMIRGLAPYVTIGFMLSVSTLIESTDMAGVSGASAELLPFRIACILCSALVFICSLLHALLYWLRRRQFSGAKPDDGPVVALQPLEVAQ